MQRSFSTPPLYRVDVKVHNPFVGWVEFPTNPERVASLCPSVTETLFMIGAGDRVVGVSSWCHRPREALSKPKIGSYVDVVEENLVKTRPQLIVTTTGVQREIIERLVKKGYPVYPIPFPKTVYDILSMVVEVGGLVGMHAEALDVSTTLAQFLEKMRSLRRPGKRLRVYVEIDLGGPTIPGYFSHVTTAFSIAGLENVFADTPSSYLYGMKVRDYPVVDVVRELTSRNPDVIVYESKSFHPSGDEGLNLMRERGLDGLEAVRNGRVLTVPADTLAHYGPSFLEEAPKLAEKIWNTL